MSADNAHIGTLTADQARVRVLTMGSLLDVFGTPKRVRYLREKGKARDTKWMPCYRNTGAPCIQPSIEYLRSIA